MQPSCGDGHRAPPGRKTRSGRLGALLNGLAGAAVGGYAFLDDLILGPIMVALAAWLPWFVIFGGAAIVLTFVNISCCNWLQRSWDAWIQGHGARLETLIAKRRRGRLLKYPIRWITRDSVVWFTIAAGLIGAVIVTAVARVGSGQPVARRRITFGSVAYSIGFAATYSGVGLGIGDLIRAL